MCRPCPPRPLAFGRRGQSVADNDVNSPFETRGALLRFLSGQCDGDSDFDVMLIEVRRALHLVRVEIQFCLTMVCNIKLNRETIL